jgi:hypothetical protein
MRTGIGLTFVGIGAILAFAVTTNTSVFNLHTAGWVIMLIGLLGLVLPRRTYGWLSRRLVRRTYPGARVDEIAAPPYRARNPRNWLANNPRTWLVKRGLPPTSSLLDTGDDPITGPPASAPPDGGRSYLPPTASGATEVIEDLYEQQ